jgi:hypothetical protein
MSSNVDIMMMVRQEQINEMRREAEHNRLLKRAVAARGKAHQSIGLRLMNRAGGILTYTGQIFIQIGERLKTDQPASQLTFAPEENC